MLQSAETVSFRLRTGFCVVCVWLSQSARDATVVWTDICLTRDLQHALHVQIEIPQDDRL